MATTSLKAQIKARDYAFVAWLCFVLGFLLLEVGWLGTHRMPVTRSILGVSCLAGAALAFKRYRMHTLALGELPEWMLGARSLQVQLACAALVAALGYLLGKAILLGFFTPTFALSTCMLFIPWSKLSISRQHLFATTMLFCLAVVLVLLTAIKSNGTIIFAIAGWVICVNGALALYLEAIARSKILPAEKQVSQLATTDVPVTN